MKVTEINQQVLEILNQEDNMNLERLDEAFREDYKDFEEFKEAFINLDNEIIEKRSNR